MMMVEKNEGQYYTTAMYGKVKNEHIDKNSENKVNSLIAKQINQIWTKAKMWLKVK